VFCVKCGAANKPGSEYCIKCGVALMPAPLAPSSPRKHRAVWLVGTAVLALIVVLGVWVASQGRRRTAPTPGTASATSPTSAVVATREPGAGWNGPLSDKQWASLAILAQGMTLPASRPVISGTVAVTELLSSTLAADGKTVHLVGQVTRKTLLCNLQPNWPAALLLVVDDGSAALPVLYRGGAEGIEPGDQVQVVGAFSASGAGISADSVRRTTSGQGNTGLVARLLQLPLRVFAAVAAAIVFFDLLVLVLCWRMRRARRVQSWEWKAPEETP
jgi:hypothetical protein